MPLLSTNIFNLELGNFEKWYFLNSDISIRISIVEIANLFWVCRCKNADEQIVENRIEIDLSEAEKYEFIHKSGVFFITFFPT